MPFETVLEIEAATLFAFGAGLLLGVLGCKLWRGSQERIAARVLTEGDARRAAETEALLDGVKLAFGEISLDTFRRLADHLLGQAQTSLAGERRLQGQQLAAERAELEGRLKSILAQFERMQNLVRELERDRASKFGELQSELKRAGERARELTETTRSLADTLVNSRARGQWGERLADDVLRAAGFVEGISYRRQAAVRDGLRRPDFTILLPQGLVVHMDVKFPFDNWQRSLEARSEESRIRHEASFVRDVRSKIVEVAKRDYVAPSEGTLEIALLFVPNEEVFAAILRLAPALVDEGLAKGVVLVSPLTLFAVLAVIRQATETFTLSRHAREIASILSGLKGAWRDYVGEHEKLGRRIEELVKAYQLLSLARRDKVERALARLDDLPSSTTPDNARAGHSDGDAQAPLPAPFREEKLTSDD
jgi:DNA recombination protein RmuC